MTALTAKFIKRSINWSFLPETFNPLDRRCCFISTTLRSLNSFTSGSVVVSTVIAGWDLRRCTPPSFRIDPESVVANRSVTPVHCHGQALKHFTHRVFRFLQENIQNYFFCEIIMKYSIRRVG